MKTENEQMNIEADELEQLESKAEEIPSEIVTQMQKEFQPTTKTSFEQGMYSGYAFGLQDGYKYSFRLNNEDKKETCMNCDKPFDINLVGSICPSCFFEKGVYDAMPEMAEFKAKMEAIEKILNENIHS